MNNNLNNLKIKNPFGKFLRNIFLGVLLLIIGFGGALMVPNLVVNANSPGGSGSDDYDNDEYGGYNYSIYGPNIYGGDPWSKNTFRNYAYTAIAREYTSDGEKASNNGYGVTKDGSNVYYEAVYYSFSDVLITSRGFRHPGANSGDDGTQYTGTAEYISDVKQIDNSAGGTEYTYFEYTNIFGVDCYSGLSIDKTPWQSGVSTAGNTGQEWYSVYPRRTGAMVAINTNNYNFIGYQIADSDAFYGSQLKMARDSNGYYFAGEEDGLATNRYRSTGSTKKINNTTYTELQDVKTGEKVYVEGVGKRSDAEIKDENGKSFSPKKYLFLENCYKTGVLPTNKTGWTADNSWSSRLSKEGYIKAKYLKEQNNGTVTLKAISSISSAGKSGKASSILGNQKTSKYNDYYVYLSPQMSAGSNYVAMVQSKTTKTITLNLVLGDSYNGGLEEVTLRQYDYYPKLGAIPTKAGYKFKGYYTSSTGGTQMYTADGKPTMVWDGSYVNATWYAQWELANYTINYNNNGGTGSLSSQTTTYNTAIKLRANTFTKTGYTFDGWKVTSGLNSSVAKYGSSSSSCTASVSSSTIIPNNYYVKNLTGVADGSVTLSAQWVGNSYTINFDSGGGTGTMDSQSATFGTVIKLKANTFTKTGYTFAGWKVTSGLDEYSPWYGSTSSCPNRVTSSAIIGNEYYVENLTTVNNGSVTLTAQWTINTYNLTIECSVYGDGKNLAVDGIDGKSITNMRSVDNVQRSATYSTSPLSFSVYIAKGGDFVVNENYYLVLKNGSETLGSGSKIDAYWTPTSNATYTIEVYNIYTISAVAGTGVQTVTTTSNTSGFDNNKVKYGDNATFTATTKLGYDTFDGWYNGTTKVSSNLSYTLTGVKANTTLTAKATPNTYTVKYDKNDTSASGTMANSSFTYDVSSYLKSNSFIAPTGKVFIGWATSASGDAVYTNAGLIKNLTATKGGTVTLYAVWGEPQSVTDGLVLNLSKWSAISSTWYDISGNGYDMTMTTATPSIKGGYIYNLPFNGSSTKSLSLTSAVTLEADVTTGSANNGLLYIFGDYYNGGCALRTDGNRFQFVINIDGAEVKVGATSTWTANTNYHLVGTYDGSEAKLYINGTMINSVATTGSITSSSASKVLVGAGYSSATNITYNYTGSIHKIKVFNRALTDSEITIEQNIADYSVTYSPNDGRNANLWNFRNITDYTSINVVASIVRNNKLTLTGSNLRVRIGNNILLTLDSTDTTAGCQFTYENSNSILSIETYDSSTTLAGISYDLSDLTQGETYDFGFSARLNESTWTISKIKMGGYVPEYTEPMQNVSFGDPYFWLYNNKTFNSGYKFNGWMKPLDLSETVTNKNIMLYFNNKTQNNVVKYGSNTIITIPANGYTQVIYNNLSGALSGFTFSGSYSNLKIISTGDTVYSGNNIHNIAKNIELSAYITQDEDAYNYEVDLNNNAYYFNSLYDAKEFCKNNNLTEITILKNVEENNAINLDTDINLKVKDSSCGIKLNSGSIMVTTGKTLQIYGGTYTTTSTSALFILNSSNAGNIIVQGGTFTSTNIMFDVAAGSVTINNGEFNKTSNYYYIIQTSGSSVNFVINGGTFNSVGSIIFNNSSSKFEINGGTFSGNNIFDTMANMTISGGTFSSTGDCGFVGIGTTSLEIKGNPYFEKPIKVDYTMDENMSIKVIGDLQSNIKFDFYGFSSNYYKRAVVTFASGLNAQDYINNFTLSNDGCGLYVDKSTNTLNASKYVKVSFNGGDLTPNSESKYVLYGDVYGDLPGASGIGGYKFSSWRMASGTEITKTSEVKTYEDHTLYANATKVHMMTDWSSRNTSVAKTAVLSIEFVSEKPTTGSQFDISGNLDGSYLGDGSVYAYYIANGNNYDVKIYSPYHLIYAPQNCSSMFYNFTNLTSIKFNNLLDTSDVTVMSKMFNNLSKLNELDLSSFNTEKVENMYQMFQGDISLVTLNISSFNFLNLNTATTIFGDLNNLENLIVNNFKTSTKLVSIAYMFSGIGLYSLDLTDMVTDNVTTVGRMFNNSKLTEIDMSTCNFGKVTDVTNMLNNCTNLTMFKAPYGKPSLAITLPSGTWKNLNNINATVGTTAYADGGVYVKYNLEEASYLNKNWYNILKAKETSLTRSLITSISFKTSSTFTSSVDVSSSLVNNICGESEYLYDCYPVTLYYGKNSDNKYSLEFVSSETIYLPTDSSMLFADLTNLTEINLIGGQIQTASILNANYMFSRTALTTLNFKNLDFSGLKSADGMLNISSLQEITTPKTVGMPINLPSTQFYNKSDSAKGPYKVINQNNVDVTIKLAYNIWFSANGGNNESCVRSVFAGETVNLNPTKLVDDSYSEYSYIRPGYTLKGWATSSNGTKVYDIGATITPTSNLSLYAIWEAISYNISYNYNGGTAGSGTYVTSIAFDKAFTVPKPTKTGYTFKGWTTSIDESNIYAMSNGERWSGKSYSNGTNLMNLLTTSGTITLIANFEKTQGSVVARIGNQEFASLKLAVDYANSQNSGTFIIYLLKSNKETSSITVNAGVTLNLVPQSTSEVQFELGTGSITNNGTLILGYDDSRTYTDADGNALSKDDLSGRFTLSSTGTTIINTDTLYIYDCKIVSGKADVENKGKIYLKNSPIFTNGISVVDSSLYVTGALSSIVPVVLDGDVEYFKTKGNAIVNFTNNALASSYANNFNITGYSTGYTSKVDTTKNSIVIAKISTLSYIVDGNVVDTESYVEDQQHALKTYSKEGYAFYGWYTEDPTGKMSTITPISVLDSSVTGDYKVYGKTIKYGERGVEGYSDSVLNINVNFDENLNASSVYGVIIVEYFDEDLGVNKVYTYSLRQGTITIKGLRYATYKITIKTTLKASSDVKEYSVRTSSSAESNVNINLTKVNKGGITSSETI